MKHPSTLETVAMLAAIVGLSGCDAVHVGPVASPVVIPQGTDATARAITPNDLIALRDIGGYRGSISVSPDGGFVAFQVQQGDPESNRYRIGWFVASTRPDAAELVSVGDGGDVILAGESAGRINGSRVDMTARWSPDSQ